MAYHRYTFAADTGNAFIIDLKHRDVLLDGNISITDDGLIVGYRRSSAWNPDQRLFFAICSDVDLTKILYKDEDSTYGIVFLPDGVKTLELQVAISGVDIDGAIANLNTAEFEDFESARKGADSIWEASLGKLTPTDATAAPTTRYIPSTPAARSIPSSRCGTPIAPCIRY